MVTSNQSPPRLRVSAFDPLTFQCSECGQQFYASDKTIAILSAEVAAHNRDKHRGTAAHAGTATDLGSSDVF